MGKNRYQECIEIVDQFTAETYGIMVYQEQVMQIVHALGDIPLRDAYTLIKAIGKKKHIPSLMQTDQSLLTVLLKKD